jgi:hypothetical protein
MECGEATKCGRQRTACELLYHTETYFAGQARRSQAQTGSFFELQQPTCVAEQHLPLIRQRNAACRTPEQGALGYELKPLDLLAHRRLRQVEPLGRAVEAPAFGYGNKRAQAIRIPSPSLILHHDQSYREMSIV